MKRARPGNSLAAVAYLRVSTDEQHLGPEAQRATIEAWASREGVTVLGWFVDVGVSGGSDIGDRPALLDALAALRSEKAGVFVVAKRDRLARDVAVAATIEKAVSSCGARVVSADGVGNGTGAADAFMRTIIDGAAAYERALIRARTKAALQAKRARGECAGKVPFGYELAADGRTLVEHEGEQAIVARVRELRAEGIALRAIVAELARAGFVARTGKPLALTQVARIASAA